MVEQQDTMIVDAALVEKQIWIEARQLVGEGSWNYVRFPALPNDTPPLQVGDAPSQWNGRHPRLPTGTKKSPPHPFQGGTPRERLTLSQEEILDKDIERLQDYVKYLVEQRDNPESTQEDKEQEEDESRLLRTKWFENSTAIGGAWLKACTGPPDGETKLDVLLVRDGTVTDLVATTVRRYCNWKVPEYNPVINRRAGTGGPGWGIAVRGIGSQVSGLFDNAQLGDCVLLQVAPPTNQVVHSNVAAKTTSQHIMMVDLDLVESQSKVNAYQMTKIKTFDQVTFPRLLDSAIDFKVGDTPWPNGNPKVNTDRSDETEEKLKARSKSRLKNSPTDALNEQIDNAQKQLDALIDLREVPGKRQEMEQEERNKASRYPSWYESAVAVGGAWIKASTWPPDGHMTMDIVLVRDGRVLEIISTTVAKFCWGIYNRTTGNYEPSSLRGNGPDWGIQIQDCAHVTAAFETELAVGDCLVLRVPPLVCDTEGQVVY